MYQFRWLLAVALVFCSSVVHAQLTVEQLPDIRISGEYDVKITRLGSVVAANAQISARLWNVPAIVSAALPVFNNRLACKGSNRIGIRVDALRLKSTGFGWSNSLDVEADAYVTSCGKGLNWYSGNITIAAPIAIAAAANKVAMRVDDVQVRNQHIRLVGIFSAPESVVIDQVKKNAVPEFKKLAAKIESAINKALLSSAVQKQFSLYKIALRTPQVAFQNDNLAVRIEIGAQVSAKAANAWLAELR